MRTPISPILRISEFRFHIPPLYTHACIITYTITLSEVRKIRVIVFELSGQLACKLILSLQKNSPNLEFCSYYEIIAINNMKCTIKAGSYFCGMRNSASPLTEPFRTIRCGFRIPRCGFRIPHCGFRIAIFGPHSACGTKKV